MKKCLLCLHFTIIIVRIDNRTRVVYDEVDQRKQKKLLELKTLKPDADFDETFHFVLSENIKNFILIKSDVEKVYFILLGREAFVLDLRRS